MRMRDDPDPALTPYEEPDDELVPETTDEESGSWVRDRLDQQVAGRPLILYLLVVAGIAVLVLLGIIIWVSARGDGRGSQSICLDIGATEAVNQVLAGGVDGATVIVDNEQPGLGPAAIQLEMSDGTCRVVPQGINNRDAMLQVLGAIEFTNTIGEQRVRTEYTRENVPDELLATFTPTPEPTATLAPETVVTETVTATVEAGGEQPPAETPTVDPNQTPPAEVPTTDPTAQPTETPAPE
jgi:hypothetical protein